MDVTETILQKRLEVGGRTLIVVISGPYLCLMIMIDFVLFLDCLKMWRKSLCVSYMRCSWWLDAFPTFDTLTRMAISSEAQS